MNVMLLRATIVLFASLSLYYIFKIINPSIRKFTFYAFLLGSLIAEITIWNLPNSYSPSLSYALYKILLTILAYIVYRRRLPKLEIK